MDFTEATEDPGGCSKLFIFHQSDAAIGGSVLPMVSVPAL